MTQRKIAGQVNLEDVARICPFISRQNHPEFEGVRQLEVEVAGVRFGAGSPVVIAGRCAVESASGAAIEFGSDGLIIEVSNYGVEAGVPKPLCDSYHAISPATPCRTVAFIRNRERTWQADLAVVSRGEPGSSC